MAIKITSKPQWHELRPGVRVQLTPPGRRKVRELVAAAGGDDEKLEELLTDYSINNWEGLVGEDGQPLPVDLANKMAVRDDNLLGRWIEERLNRPLMVEEEEIKNS